MAPFAGARQMKNRGGLSLGRDGNQIAGTEQTRATNQGPYAFVGYAW